MGLDIEKVQAIVEADEKKRYDLRFETSVEESASDAVTAEAQVSGEEQGGLWWIKANQGHSMKVRTDLAKRMTPDERSKLTCLLGCQARTEAHTVVRRYPF